MSSHEKYTLIKVPTTNILSIVVKPHYSNNTPTHLLTSIIYIYIYIYYLFSGFYVNDINYFFPARKSAYIMIYKQIVKKYGWIDKMSILKKPKTKYPHLENAKRGCLQELHPHSIVGKFSLLEKKKLELLGNVLVN